MSKPDSGLFPQGSGLLALGCPLAVIVGIGLITEGQHPGSLILGIILVLAGLIVGIGYVPFLNWRDRHQS